MSFRMITGRSGAGKSSFIHNEIAETLQYKPLGTPIFIIVPSHMSFSVEHRLSTAYELHGMIRAQVVTFKRLAWRILQETSGIAKQEVDEFGYRMLVKSVLEENREEFKLFRQAASKRGFTEQIGDLLLEFSRYAVDDVSLQQLQSSLHEQKAPRTLIDKASDLSLLLSKIEEKLGTSYVDGEGYLRLLVEQVKNSTLLQEAEIYIDGFDKFTTREYEIIEQLFMYSKRVTIVLPVEEVDPAVESHQLLYTGTRTAVQLLEIAKKVGSSLEDSVHLTTSERFQNADIEHVEKSFDQYPVQAKKNEGHVQFIEATDRRSEIHAVARTIREYVAKGKRYENIGILYRQAEAYDELIETTFSHYDIPVFISRKKPMLHHPLVEFSRSVLEIVTSGWSYEAIFRAVKTDLFFPHGENKKLWRERADRLENYVLAHGIVYSSRWFDDARWIVKKYRGLELYTDVQTDAERAEQEELHLVRDVIREPLATFENKVKRAKVGRDIAQALFELVEQLHIYDKMIDLRTAEENAGQLLQATEHEQAWNSWIHILDQFVLMFGDRQMTNKDAAMVLDEGFDTLEFTRIPPSVDQVTVTTIEQANALEVDIAFVIGVNDGVLPQRIEHEGILSDTEREWFSTLGIELAPTSKLVLMNEMYAAYRAFVTPKEALYISYPIADEEGKSLIPSLYIARIGQILENTKTLHAVADLEELPDDLFTLSYISHPRAALPYAANQTKRIVQGEAISPEWRAVLEFYKRDMLWSSILKKVLRPLTVGNQTERLQHELTTALYGETLSSSVSRVESYYSCPFQHFATYGLRLHERTQFTLEAPAIGDLFHATLKWISDELIRIGKSWSDLTREESWQLANDAVEAITPYFFNKILLSTSRYMYIKRKLTQIIYQTIFSMRTQAKVSSFHTVAVEAGFGPGEQMPPLIIPLQAQREMHLRGRIDRIDRAEIEGQHYLRVVDYKSSEQVLDLTEVLYGLSLQMMTYLDVALQYSMQLIGTEADPAGVLYMHVHNPMIRPTGELVQEALDKEITKSYKMQGYLIENTQVVEQMDQEIGRSSNIVPAAIKTDGTFTKASKVLSTGDMEVVRQYVRSRHQLAGDAMLAGDTRVYPYKLKNNMPCTYCSYRSVCQFDASDAKQSYRNYEALGAEQSLEKMREEVER